MSARVGAIVFSPIPYIPRVPGSYFSVFSVLCYTIYIIEPLSLTVNDGSGHGPSLGLYPRPCWGVPPQTPERPPAYEYGARCEMVLPASTVPREVEIHRR